MKLIHIIEVARGEKEADLLLKNGKLINVFSGEIYQMDVAIYKGIIVGLGEGYQAKNVIDIKGKYLIEQLNRLHDLEIVGDVRGIGMFCGIEFVKDKATKKPFHPSQKVNGKFFHAAFRRGLITYPGSGSADGISGDHTLICPPFIITKEQIDTLMQILREAITEVAAAL